MTPLRYIGSDVTVKQYQSVSPVYLEGRQLYGEGAPTLFVERCAIKTTPLQLMGTDVLVTQTPLDYTRSGVRHDRPQAGPAGVESGG